MSLVDQNGNPLAYGWNDDAAAERCKKDSTVTMISDAEFEELFPDLFRPPGDESP